MKVAFLCEGYSEHDALPNLLYSLGITSYEFLKHSDSEPSPGYIGVFRLNYKNVGLLLKPAIGLDGLTRRMFMIDATELLYSRSFDKIIVWFDNEGVEPVCDQSRRLKQEMSLIFPAQDAQLITLVIANRYLENWYFSSTELFSRLFEKDLANVCTECLDILNLDEVDDVGVGKCLSQISNSSKQSTACKFFSLLEPNAPIKSSSLARAIRKIRLAFGV